MSAMQETQVRSMGWEDPLEKEMATQPLYACLENLMDRGAWGLWSLGSQRVRHDWAANTHTHTHTLPPNTNVLNFIFEYFEFYFSSNIHTRKKDELLFFYQNVTLIKFTRLMAKTHWWWRLEDKFLKYRIIYFMLKVNSVSLLNLLQILVFQSIQHNCLWDSLLWVLWNQNWGSPVWAAMSFIQSKLDQLTSKM